MSYKVGDIITISYRGTWIHKSTVPGTVLRDPKGRVRVRAVSEENDGYIFTDRLGTAEGDYEILWMPEPEKEVPLGAVLRSVWYGEENPETGSMSTHHDWDLVAAWVEENFVRR